MSRIPNHNGDYLNMVHVPEPRLFRWYQRNGRGLAPGALKSVRVVGVFRGSNPKSVCSQPEESLTHGIGHVEKKPVGVGLVLR